MFALKYNRDINLSVFKFHHEVVIEGCDVDEVLFDMVIKLIFNESNRLGHQ